MNAAESMIRTIEHEGVRYRFAMPSAVQQRAVLFRLGKYGIEPLIRGLALSQIGGSSSIAVAGSIVGSMFQRIPEDDFNFICETMLGKLHAEGGKEPLTIEHFSGRLKTYFTLVVLAMGNVFEDFTGLLTLFQSSTASPAEAAAQEAPETTQPSTGSSGDPV